MLGIVQSVLLLLFQLIMGYSLVRLIQVREEPVVHAIAWGSVAILDGLAFFISLLFAPVWAAIASFIIGFIVAIYILAVETPREV